MATGTLTEKDHDMLAGAAPVPVTGGTSTVPDWFPDWAREMADLYFTANTCVFILYGNVNDLIYCQCPDAGVAADHTLPVADLFCGLTEFVAHQIFGNWDIVISYDLGRGIQAEAGTNSKRLKDMMQYLTSTLGSPATWSRDPDVVLTALDRLIQRNLLEDNLQNRKRIAFLFPYSQYLVPSGDHATLARTQAARLVRFLSWAQNPYIKRVNMAFCLVTETLNEVSDELVQNPHVATIEIPLPTDEIRRKFVESQWASRFSRKVSTSDSPAIPPAVVDISTKQEITAPAPLPATAPAEFNISVKGPSVIGGQLSVDAVTQLSNGLNLVNLNVALWQRLRTPPASTSSSSASSKKA